MRRPGVYSRMLSDGEVSGRTGPYSLPLTRIKKIMKRSGEGGAMMISMEAPMVFCKVCELFIEELTRRSWATAAVNGKRRTLLREDVADAIKNTDNFDFLVAVVSAASGRAGRGSQPAAGEESDGVVSDVCSF
ncbi:hypothetical protein HPP92_025725 [Vanilla planifolia]|uniref:Transcription factor CBF/NF-Y/archaeal histone domain-containing protein n=1 Tax=Vanilla planifolia TaxID=51239 RepID=A0A835PIZ1_VANPL|nr:hypothetical protein HPP92_025725 [Vanilla planifolia]